MLRNVVMFWAIFFWVLFLSATGYVLVKGSRPAKLAICVMIFGVAATTAVYALGTHKWLPLNQSILIIDMIALTLFGILAVRSSALWPIFLVGWQLATVVIHIVSLFAVDLVPDAYGIGQGIWAYLQFATIFGVSLIERRQATRNSLQERSEIDT
jgi:hypothetical protein